MTANHSEFYRKLREYSVTHERVQAIRQRNKLRSIFKEIDKSAKECFRG